MKLLFAIFLVFIAMCDAEPPRFRSFARQTAKAPAGGAPYPARGWRPQGASFSLPQQTYGAPPKEPEEPTSTTEPETTTEIGTEETITNRPKFERLRDSGKPTKLQQVRQEQQPINTNPVYLVVPQRQNYYYTLERSAPLLGVPQGSILTPSRLTAIPVGRAASTSIYTPYTSYVQIYQ